MQLPEDFKQRLERKLGRTLEANQRMTILESRMAVETARGTPLRFVSKFPLIGRGNTMRDRLVSHEEVEREFVRALED